ncbi:hypothetical protein [Flexibacterium corallicola]|uniref:hypothetical protein n=1 Tax=Flexibacterium corallicola TaxID=3037259 RepID=UPI00286F0630|nr:hypothetical protein [Pseudovibrio sp. M1P-2-3]
MKVVARCHPALRKVLPAPVPAAQMLPEWFRSMPGKTVSPTLGGETVRTLKHCPPLIDALTLGVCILLPTDLHFEGGEVFWDWNPPIISDSPISRAPIGVHVPEQAEGAPLGQSDELLLKFMNFWSLEAPEGWQLLFTHPMNRSDLPFQTLSGLVDSDRFKHGYVHFPAILQKGFEGTIVKGTPIAQIVAVPAQEQPELLVENMSEDWVEESARVQRELQTDTGVYRKKYRR